MIIFVFYRKDNITMREERQITMDELLQLATEAAGLITRQYWHWTGGDYNTTHTDKYHIAIKGDGTMWTSCTSLTEKLNHTFMRNSNSVGINICACLDAVHQNNLGPYPPTEAQLNTLSQAAAAICINAGIPLDIQHCMTHAEAADNRDGWYAHEPYGPDTTVERWDLDVLREGEPPRSGGDSIRGNARYYATQWGSII